MKTKIDKTKTKVVGGEQNISISPIQIATVNIKVEGTSSLLMERFSDKSRQQLLDTVTGKPKEKRKNRDLDIEVAEKIHKMSDGRVGFPAEGFKKAMVATAPYIDSLNMKLAKGSFFVMGIDNNLIPIQYKKQVTNKALGRDSGINRAPREIWRPEFQGWSAVIPIRYNASQISVDQLVQLLRLAGFHIGVGGWTPQHGGSYGMFQVASGSS